MKKFLINNFLNKLKRMIFMIFIFVLLPNTISLGLTRIKAPNIRFDNVTQTEGSTFELTPHTNFGNCSCDVTNQCDPYCCCDPDCSGVLFPYCLETASFQHNLRYCSDSENEGGGKVIEWFLRTSLCIQRDNNPSPGDFYDLDINFDDSNIDDLDGQIQNNPSSLRNIFSISEDPTRRYWNPLSPIKITDSENLKIRRRSKNGECEERDLLYLESINEDCYPRDQNNCSIFLRPSECEQNATCIQNMINQNTVNCNRSYPIHIDVKWGEVVEHPPPSGYKLGEAIQDGNGNDIKVGAHCITDDWKLFPIEFGKQADILCELEPFNYTEENATEFDFRNSTITFWPSNYSISPHVNNIPNNVGTIQEEYPEPMIAKSELYIVESFTIIYKTIGLKENPQRIISDFKVRYHAFSSHNATLRMIIHFFEQPNELNMFDIPSESDLHQWLPF